LRWRQATIASSGRRDRFTAAKAVAGKVPRRRSLPASGEFRRCGGLPSEPVRIGERLGCAADRDPVRATSFGGGTGVFGERLTLVQRELDGAGPGSEFDAHAAEALPDGEAVVE